MINRNNNQMTKRRRQRPNKRNARKTKRETNEYELLDKMIVAPYPANLCKSSPFPSSMKRVLQFHWNGVIANGANSWVTQDFKINSWTAPVAGQTCTGYAQLQAIYQYYKVLRCKVRYVVVGLDPTLPIFFGLVFRDVQPSTTITSYVLSKDSLEAAPTTGPNLVGSSAGESTYRSPWHKIHLADIVGSAIDYYSQVAYSGIAASPTSAVWCSFTAYSNAVGTAMTNGCQLDIQFLLSGVAYDMLNLAA